MRSSAENIRNTGRTITTGGVIRSARKPKKRCLSPTKKYREKAYAASRATGMVIRMFNVTYVTELMIEAVNGAF